MSDRARPVAILCGGKGTRLGYEGQKCLVPIAGRPFLHWKFDQLVEHGATEFHLLANISQQDEMMAAYCAWSGDIDAFFHYDDHLGQTGAHRQAAPHMPFLHWLTYGDGLLDAPLRDSLMPYRYHNDEFDDAGLMYCWGASWRFIPKKTTSPSYHINTPDDYARTEKYLADLH